MRGIDADLADEHVDGGHQVGVEFLHAHRTHRRVDRALRGGGQCHQGLTVTHVAGGAPGVFEAAPHRQHQLRAPDERRAPPGGADRLVGERIQVAGLTAQRDQVGTGVAQRLGGPAPRPQFAADRARVDAVLGHPGGHHAASDRIGVEHLPDRGGVAHHRDPSLVDEAEKGRSRHRDSFCGLRSW